MTLERLERRRGDTWQGMWLAPLIAIVAQAFLLGVLVDENIGWLARAAVLVAAVATSLSAIWSVLRAHARAVQYSEAISEWTANSDGYHPDLRPSALARPHRRRRGAVPSGPAPSAPGTSAPTAPDTAATATATTDQKPDEGEAGAEAATTVDATPGSEGETTVLDATPPPMPKAGAPGVKMPPPSPGRTHDGDGSGGWVSRWDRHLVWWASGDAHAKAYMGWTATLALFALADVAVYLASV